MLPGEQQQQFIFALAERRGIFRGLLLLPDAQAEIKAFSGTFLRQPSGKPEFTDVKLYGDRPQ